MTGSEPEAPRIRLNGWRGKMLRWRVRVGKALLVPQLAPAEAFDLRHRVIEEGSLTKGYVLMCALSAGIATLGLLQSSTAVVIGAMLISPLMSPIAALGFGFASIDGQRIRDAARVVLVGAAIGILTGVLLTWLSPIRNATPEILARTQPTLLDLGVALLSGLAGGYATVLGKGGTAIGVAIATALMPPLATVGYGLAVFQPAYALGAFLLFLTNLSAIAFAFALVSRLSGAARPLRNVEWTPRYALFGMAAFLALATPLALTLIQVTHEARLRLEARRAIAAATGIRPGNIAQLDVSWPLFGSPQVDAVLVTPTYSAQADEEVRARLAESSGTELTVNLQQVVAADLSGQAQAMVDAAMERTAAGIAADVPPFARIRASVGLPTRGVWTNRAERIINVEPVAAPGWTLADYRRAEQRAQSVSDGWNVRILPPVSETLRVALSGGAVPEGTVPADLAIWALQRWGLTRVGLTIAPEADSAALLAAMKRAGIDGEETILEGEADGEAVLEILRPPPDRPAASPAVLRDQGAVGPAAQNSAE